MFGKPWRTWKWFRMGYSPGTYIYTPISVQFKQGLKEWPELYAGLFHGIIAIVWFTQSVVKAEKDHEWVARYKRKYTIYRPDDDRLRLYPRSFLTDKHLLAPDHPEKLTDIPKVRLPSSGVHENDDIHPSKKTLEDIMRGSL